MAQLGGPCNAALAHPRFPRALERSRSRLRPRHVQQRLGQLGMHQYARATAHAFRPGLKSARPETHVRCSLSHCRLRCQHVQHRHRQLGLRQYAPQHRRPERALPIVSSLLTRCSRVVRLDCPAQSTSPAKSAGCTCGAGYYSLAGSGLATVGSPCLGRNAPSAVSFSFHHSSTYLF